MPTLAIIEDEPPIRKEISCLVAEEADIELIGWSGSVQAAANLINDKKPDILLMDIQLQDGTAFDLLKKLSPIPQNIIFITAYNHFAIKAIKFGALDYLLKPINKVELREALERYRRRAGDHPEWMLQLSVAEIAMDSGNIPESIVLSSVNNVKVVLVADIIYCKSGGPYTYFFLKDGSQILISKPLKYYQELLPAPFFIRPHQSFLVNRDHILRISRSEYLILKNEVKIPISLRRKSIVLGYLSIK